MNDERKGAGGPEGAGKEPEPEPEPEKGNAAAEWEAGRGDLALGGGQSRDRGLGRGLSALFEDDEGEDYASLDRVRRPKDVPISLLRPNRHQPRRRFDDDKLAELAQSLREKGMLQPILVRRDPEDAGLYEIIAGERRWRAAQRAQLHEVPVLVREFSDAETLEIALIENVQRDDLTPIEEAQGYHRLMEEFAHNQEELARIVGKSRSHVANMLRLLSLPERVRAMVDEGTLSMGHARAVVTAADPEHLAAEIARRGLSVRQAETLARGDRRERARKPRRQRAKDPDTLALERDLAQALGLRIEINHRGERGGSVILHYRTLEQLDEVCRRLCHPHDRPA